MTTIDTARIRALAEKATPGERVVDEGSLVKVRGGQIIGQGFGVNWRNDLAYTAATDPQTMIALLDELHAAQTDHNDSEKALIDSVNALADERDALQARIDAAEDFVTRHYLDTQMGGSVLAILSAPTENGENDDQ